MIISLDTETTGIDLAHGACPFLVTTCWADDGKVRYWEWPVNPLTRKPIIPDNDLCTITELLEAADIIYGQNLKFDARALATIGIALPWAKARDTLVAGHLLATNHPHNLTWMCMSYLGADIEPHEIHVKQVVKECRTIVERLYPDWRIAREGLPEMPSVKTSSDRDEDKPWKNDMWLPRALAKQMIVDGKITPEAVESSWLTACAKYANADSEHTLYLGLEMERIIRERKLWAIYEHRLNLPRVACEMESYGVTAIGEYTKATIQEFECHITEAEVELVAIAGEYGHQLELAKGAALNDNMRDFFYGAKHLECRRCEYTKRIKHWNGEDADADAECPKCGKGNKRRVAVREKLGIKAQPNLALRVIGNKKTGNAALDKDVMQDYIQMLDDGPALDFITILADKRNYDTALTYMQAYERFWVPMLGVPGFYRIHPSLNPCGTDHLRWASNSPNMQNVSGESRDISNRACFGPLPSREWWRMDFKSIERRIPPYECGEPKMVEVFEKPNSGPYWGSLYYLTASVLYPDEFWPRADDPNKFKKECPRLYKQAKFFDLAKQYGAGRRKGDLLSKIKNSYDLVDNEFPLLAELQTKYLRMAEKLGYVETLPDRSVDPTRGYPVLASRTEDGRILSTTPFNYHVSGTACWCKNIALVLCSNQCAQWRAEGFDANIALEIHDEILFDFPRGKDMQENMDRAMVLRGLMASTGDNLIPAIPTPISMEYHTQSWANGVSVA